MDVARSPETAANPFRVPSRARHTTPARQAFTEELPSEFVSGHHGGPGVATATESLPTVAHREQCMPSAGIAPPQYAPTGLRMALKVLHMMIRSPVSDQFST